MRYLCHIGIVFLHWTWGILQTVVGFIVFLIFIENRHIWYNGAVITEIKGNWGGISIGMFAFVDNMPQGKEAYKSNLVKHEYGHTLQSILLGVLWVFIVAIPSLIWAGCFKKWRKKHNISYYSMPIEHWADKWGGVNRKPQN